MNTTQRWTIAIIAAVAIGVALFAGGLALGGTSGNVTGFGPGNMMTGYAPNQSGLPYGMMGGSGMMSGNSGRLSGVKPLTVDQAKQAVNTYLASLSNPDLVISEIMIFDNNAYARITEKSTGIGAFELLVDPVTRSVFPEYGPNMMWNLKYGMMSGGFGSMMGGGMMGQITPPTTTGQMPLTAEEAQQAAQHYLNTYLPGAQAAKEPDQFYGYYTIEILRDDKPVGMLSVNGYTQQVFVHTWHGNFIELSEN